MRICVLSVPVLSQKVTVSGLKLKMFANHERFGVLDEARMGDGREMLIFLRWNFGVPMEVAGASPGACRDLTAGIAMVSFFMARLRVAVAVAEASASAFSPSILSLGAVTRSLGSGDTPTLSISALSLSLSPPTSPLTLPLTPPLTLKSPTPASIPASPVGRLLAGLESGSSWGDVS